MTHIIQVINDILKDYAATQDSAITVEFDPMGLCAVINDGDIWIGTIELIGDLIEFMVASYYDVPEYYAAVGVEDGDIEAFIDRVIHILWREE